MDCFISVVQDVPFVQVTKCIATALFLCYPYRGIWDERIAHQASWLISDNRYMQL